MTDLTDKENGLLLAFGSAIRDGRIKRGMTQAELGDRMGVCRAQIANVENGHCFMSLGYIVLVINVLKLKANDLIPTEAKGKRYMRLEKKMNGNSKKIRSLQKQIARARAKVKR